MGLDFSRLRAISNQQEQTRFTTAAQDFADTPPDSPLEGAIELPKEEAERVGAIFAIEQMKNRVKDGASADDLLRIAVAALADIAEDKSFPEDLTKLRKTKERYGINAWEDAAAIYYKYRNAATVEEFEAFTDACNELANRNYVGKACALALAESLEI